MSLTVALKAVDGLVLAADSRVTEGYTLEGPKTQDNSVKFIQLNDDWGVQTYGNSDIGHAGISTLKEETSTNIPRHPSLSSLLDKSGQVFRRESLRWSGDHPEIHRNDKDVGFVLAGHDREGGELKVFKFQSPDFTPESVQQGCLLAGQWHIARYFVRRLYRKEISIEKSKELAVLLLRATMTVEKTVGGAIRLAVVTPTTGFRWASEDEIGMLMKESELLEKAFQEQLQASLSRVHDEDRRKNASGDTHRAG